LELAAKAAGIALAENPFLHCHGDGAILDNARLIWNPLTDDCEALQLAVKPRISVQQGAVEATGSSTVDGTDSMRPTVVGRRPDARK
jgi:hypothetical protein